MRKKIVIIKYTVNTMFDWLYNFVISILTYLSNLFGLKSNFLDEAQQQVQQGQQGQPQPDQSYETQ